MKNKVIKPDKKSRDNSSLLGSIVYLLLGIILAFMSDTAVKIVFYIIGIIIIVYGIKSLVLYMRNKESIKYGNANLGLAIIAIILGILVIVLSGAMEVAIRYILGFFFVFIGASKLFTALSTNNLGIYEIVSNAVLIILGLYSIFFSNAVLVIIGWILILNACFGFYEYIKG